MEAEKSKKVVRYISNNLKIYISDDNGLEIYHKLFDDKKLGAQYSKVLITPDETKVLFNSLAEKFIPSSPCIRNCEEAN